MSKSFLRSLSNFGGIFDIDQKLEELKELEHKAQNPELWKNPKEMEKVNRDKAIIERTCEQWNELNSKIDDVSVLLDMAEEEKDEDSFLEAVDEVPNYVLHSYSYLRYQKLNSSLI